MREMLAPSLDAVPLRRWIRPRKRQKQATAVISRAELRCTSRARTRPSLALGACDLRVCRCLGPAAQHLGHAPGLRDTAARGVGLLRVKNLADRADASLAEMADKTLQEVPCFTPPVGMDLEPGVDKGADQPGPDRALVIGRVSRAE